MTNDLGEAVKTLKAGKAITVISVGAGIGKKQRRHPVWDGKH